MTPSQPKASASDAREKWAPQSENKRAFFKYQFEEKLEAGIVLAGTEVKAMREGRIQLRDAYALFRGSELFLVNAHISPYRLGNRENHEPLRTRKLLLHKSELKRWWGKAQIRGHAIIPLRTYFKDGRVKVELGLGKSKTAFDKRRTIRERETQREIALTTRTARR